MNQTHRTGLSSTRLPHHLRLVIGAVLFLSFIFSLSSVRAQPPIFIGGNFESGYYIETPQIDDRPLGQDQEFHLHVYNGSTGIPMTPPIETISCLLHIYNVQGEQIYRNNFIGNDGYEWSVKVPAHYFNYSGSYAYLGACNSSAYGGYIQQNFTVTTTGDIFLFLILVGVGLLLLVFAVLMGNEYLGFAAGVLFIVAGIYGMVYGVGGFSDLYSQAISFTLIGVGLLFEIAAGYKVAATPES